MTSPIVTALRGTRARNDRFYWYLIALPPLLVAFLLSIGFVRDQTRARNNRWWSQYQQRQGIPTDESSLVQFFAANSSTEHSAAWMQIAAAAHFIESQTWPLVDHVSDLDLLVPQGEVWPAEPIASQFGKLGAPVIARIEAIPAADKPAWFPEVMAAETVRFPYIADHRTVTRIILHDFRIAYHAGETDRALRDIKSISKLSIAYDGHHRLVEELVQTAVESIQDGAIRKSLAHEFWSAEQLQGLRDVLAARKPLDVRWHNMLDEEQIFVAANMRKLPMVQNRNGRSTGFAGANQNLFRSLRQIPDVGSVDFGSTVFDIFNSTSTPRRHQAVSITAIPLATEQQLLASLTPAFAAAAETFVRRRIDRDWTVCAVGLKQFQLRFKRFPDRLDQLADVGLTPDQWTAINSRIYGSKPFGYRVSADGSAATLWTGDTIQNIRYDSSPPPQPPSEIENEPFAGLTDHFETIIR